MSGSPADADEGVRLVVPRFSQAFTGRDWPAGVRLRGQGPEYWSGRTCGVACLRMVLAHFRRPVPSLFTLLAAGLAADVYTDRGWLHAGLAGLARRRGLAACALPLAVHEIGEVLKTFGPVVLSVGHRFPTDGRRGGHLVTVAGRFAASGRIHLDIRDPAPSGAAVPILPVERVAASYAGRALVFARPGQPRP